MVQLTPAEKQKEYRVRQACGIRITPVPLPDDVTIRLIEEGWFSDGASLDPKRRGEGLLHFIRHHLKSYA